MRPETPPAPRPAPWYRHRWPWLLMAGPALVVAGGAYVAWLAASTDDGLVADDYYRRGLAINQTLERATRAAALGLAADVAVAADGGVRMTLSGAGDASPPAVRLRLVHPTRAGLDRAASLVRGADGRYAGRIAPADGGRWLVIVETDEWRLPPVEVGGAPVDVHLAAGR
jgi:hypothetical protein